GSPLPLVLRRAEARPCDEARRGPRQERVDLSVARDDGAGHHRARQVEVERELDGSRFRASIKRYLALLPRAELPDPIATLIADRAEEVQHAAEAGRDERVPEPTTVVAELDEGRVELRPRDTAAPHQVFAEELLASRGRHVVQASRLQIDFLAHRRGA